ncbi:MAG: MBL fold metallo-hydrolase [Streptosporangiaceae bacterium]
MAVPATDDAAADWTEPGTFLVLPGVYRIPLPLPGDGLRAVNVYAIEDGDALVVVDAGWALAESRERLRAALAVLGCGIGDVRRFLVTHIHRDHYTQAVALRREFGGRVGLGEGERPSLRVAADPTSRALAPQLDRLRACGAGPVTERLLEAGAAHPRDTSIWEQPDDWIGDGAEIDLEKRTLRALPTPGHTRGHLVFLDADAGVLFAGDHVLPHITPSIGFEPAPTELPLGDYLRSLRLVRQLPDVRLLPAHGPVADSVHTRVDELLAHHDTRLTATADTIARGADTAYAAARMLRWTRRERRFDDLDPFNQMLAVNETAAHLDLLAAQARLRASVRDGVTHYTFDH